MIANSKLYDWLKFIALIVLPGVATLYFALAQVWSWDNGAAIVGTITAVDAFLGLLLGISTSNYNKSDVKYDGHVIINDTEDKKVISLNVNGDPNDIGNKKELVLKVGPSPVPLEPGHD